MNRDSDTDPHVLRLIENIQYTKKIKDEVEILLERNKAHNETLQLINELKSDKPYYTDYLSPHKLGDTNIALLADFKAGKLRTRLE